MTTDLRRPTVGAAGTAAGTVPERLDLDDLLRQVGDVPPRVVEAVHASESGWATLAAALGLPGRAAVGDVVAAVRSQMLAMASDLADAREALYRVTRLVVGPDGERLLDESGHEAVAGVVEAHLVADRDLLRRIVAALTRTAVEDLTDDQVGTAASVLERVRLFAAQAPAAPVAAVGREPMLLLLSVARDILPAKDRPVSGEQDYQTRSAKWDAQVSAARLVLDRMTGVMA